MGYWKFLLLFFFLFIKSKTELNNLIHNANLILYTSGFRLKNASLKYVFQTDYYKKISQLTLPERKNVLSLHLQNFVSKIINDDKSTNKNASYILMQIFFYLNFTITDQRFIFFYSLIYEINALFKYIFKTFV